MRCKNCGASLVTVICDYCGGYGGSSDDASERLSEHSENISKLLKKIEYLKKSGAPESVVEKKIAVYTKRLLNLGYKY